MGDRFDYFAGVHTLPGLLLAYGLASAFSPASLAQVAANRPNVVVLVADDLGTLDLRCYGSDDLQTPHLDALAGRGVKLTAAYAHAVCCPSRAALLTGRHPQRTGINDWVQGDAHAGVRRNNLPLAEVTLAEIVEPLGYRTALFGKWHVGGSLEHGPLSQGFDEYMGLRNGFIDNYSHYYLHGEGYHDLWDGNEEVFRPGQYFPEMITTRAVDFIERAAAASQPFLVYVGFSLPHYPEQALSAFDSLYSELDEPRRSYAATVSTVDAHVGRILATIEAAGLTDSTLVVFVSDNGHSAERYSITTPDHPSGRPLGDAYGAKGGGGNTGSWRGAKGTFLEGGIRVPMILSYPAVLPAGAQRNQAVTVMDVLPTLVDLLGTPPPDVPLDGHSLLPVLARADAAESYDALHFQWKDGWAVREGPWKLIYNGHTAETAFGLPPGAARGLPQRFLARLDEPEPEGRNHAEAQPQLVERLIQLHEAWLAEVTPEEGFLTGEE